MSFLDAARGNPVELRDGHRLCTSLNLFDFLTRKWNRVSISLDLDGCIGNIDGKFAWGGQGYSNTATDVSLEVLDSPPRAYLRATLKKDDASYVQACIDLNEGIAILNGIFKFQPVNEVHSLPPLPPSPPAPTDSSQPSSRADTLSQEQAQGTITTLPPHTPLCTAFAATFTEPSGRQLRFTACPIIAIPTFSAKVTLHYGEMSEASGMRSFGGSASKTKVSLYLDNGVRIVGEVVQGGPDKEVTIAGSGHWGISR